MNATNLYPTLRPLFLFVRSVRLVCVALSTCFGSAPPCPQAMVLDAPASLQVVSLEEGHVDKTDRVVVGPML